MRTPYTSKPIERHRNATSGDVTPDLSG